MIKACRQKSRGLVAVDAITVGGHMVAGLACGGIAVVARRTVVDDALVIEVGSSKRRGRMAHRAVVGGRNMRRVDLGILAGGINPVVARLTVIGDADVTEHRRHKATARYVTDSAILSGYDVIRLGIHAGRIHPVVAGIASAT